MYRSKNKIVNFINSFYELVKLSAEAWIILFKNLIVYGWIDATCYLTAYLMQPMNERDSFTEFKRDNPIHLKYRKGVSFLGSIILFGWIASYIYLLKNGYNSSFISLLFVILSLWLIVLIVYLSMFGLVWANNDYKNDQMYYAKTFIQLVKDPFLTLTILSSWIIMILVCIRCFLLIFFLVPGLICKIKVAMFQHRRQAKRV